jgi:hypothetical protein
VTRKRMADDPFGVDRDSPTKESIVTCLLYFSAPEIPVKAVSLLSSLSKP